MIIPSALQFTAERLMKSQGRTGTADNDINAVGSMGMIPQGYTVNHYLTDTDAFFIKTDVPNGLKMFVRAPIKTAMEGDFDTGNVRYKARGDILLDSQTLEVSSDHQERNLNNFVAGHSSATIK